MPEPNYLTLNPNEEIILESYRHWVNILPFFISTAVVIIMGFLAIGYVGANPADAERLFPGLTVGIVTPIVALLDVLALAILFFAYIVYRQNRIVLTNMHFVQITQSGLFTRTLSKLSLDELQDVRGTRKGVFGTILNYGEILIETAGNEENFFFRPAPDPLNIAEAINDTHEYYEKSKHGQGGLADETYAAQKTAEAAGVTPPVSPTPTPTPAPPQTGEFPDQAFSDPSPDDQSPRRY